jgi:hypothetical protein
MLALRTARVLFRFITDAHNQVADNAYTSVTKSHRPNQIVIQYAAPNNPDLQEIYGRLQDRHFLERIQYILSALRLPEELIVKTKECGVVNAWYTREESKPTVTICYELLKTVSQSMPKQTTSAADVIFESAAPRAKG